RDSGAAPAFSGRLGPTSLAPAKTWHSGCGRAIVIHVKKNTASTRRLVSNGEGNADEPADKTFGVARVGGISDGRRARPSPHRQCASQDRGGLVDPGLCARRG